MSFKEQKASVAPTQAKGDKSKAPLVSLGQDTDSSLSDEGEIRGVEGDVSNPDIAESFNKDLAEITPSEEKVGGSSRYSCQSS